MQALFKTYCVLSDGLIEMSCTVRKSVEGLKQKYKVLNFSDEKGK